MRGRQRTIYLGLAFVMILGIAVYFRLWAIDYRISVDEAESLRRQFDLASKEAMDESASWRLRYDGEAERASKCDKELIQIKESLVEKAEDAANINKKLEMLQKENMGLLERVEYLKQELEAEKLKCNMH
ncbi:uncharacterized protein LOC132293418 [Cornus florida]|uniref:uncharacterized protein LOC132293418 n=1 Tax=Cornus florida TaxID=4283 RepID=UPI0028A1C401|nr:uncharacterized protein LOC132293418 [Cornus florida]